MLLKDTAVSTIFNLSARQRPISKQIIWINYNKGCLRRRLKSTVAQKRKWEIWKETVLANFKNGISDWRLLLLFFFSDRLCFMFFSVLFLDYNLRVSPRLKDRTVEGDRPVSNFVMSQDTCLHLSDLLPLYIEKRDTTQVLCQRPK